MRDPRQERLISATTAALSRHLAGGPLALPEAAKIVWPLFLDLHEARGFSSAGPQPIAYGEIAAYAALLSWPLAPHHIALIRALDRAWLAHIERGGHDAPSADQAPAISAAAFDAVFG